MSKRTSTPNRLLQVEESDMATQTPNLTSQLERINKIVRNRGDIDLFMKLDQIMDRQTEAEQNAALEAVVKELSATKRKTN